MKRAFADVVGKSVQSVIVSERNRAGPIDRVFLIFTDGTTIELYGDFNVANLDPGGAERAISSARKNESQVTQYP